MASSCVDVAYGLSTVARMREWVIVGMSMTAAAAAAAGDAVGSTWSTLATAMGRPVTESIPVARVSSAGPGTGRGMGAHGAVAGGGVASDAADMTATTGVAAGVAVRACRCPPPAWGPLAKAGLAAGKPGGTGGAVAPAASVAAAAESPEALCLIPRRAVSKLQGRVGIVSVFRPNFSLYATKKL